MKEKMIKQNDPYPTWVVCYNKDGKREELYFTGMADAREAGILLWRESKQISIYKVELIFQMSED